MAYITRMHPRALAQEAPRWTELDGVRGLAALLVVYVHLFLRWVPASPKPVFWLRTLSGMSWTGVDLFFILSGFLIGGILLRNRDAGNYFSVFYLRRAFRIFPLYFALLAVFFFIRFFLPVGQDPSMAGGAIPLWSYPLLLQNFHMALSGDWGPGPLGVTWSVALEEQFYLFLPLFIRLVPVRWHFASFCLLALSAPVFRIFSHLAAPTFLLPGSLEPLFSGVILAWLFLYRPVVFKAPAWRGLAAALFAAGSVGMAWLAVRGLPSCLAHFRETVVTLFWGSFLWLVLAHLGTPLTAPLRWRPLCWVGGISYGVYLLHPLISHLVFLGVFGSMPKESMGMSGFLLTCFCLAVILLVAFLSFHFAERRLTAIGHRLHYKKRAENPAAPALL